MNRLLLFISLLVSPMLLAQHQDNVDFTHADIAIRINPNYKSIEGKVFYTFKVLNSVDSVFLDAQNMDFSSVHLNNKKAKYDYNGQTLSIYKKLKKGKTYGIALDYTTKPKQTIYFIGWDASTKPVLSEAERPSANFEKDLQQPEMPANRQVWTQGQGKYSSHWVPSFDAMEEKVEFDMDITFNRDFTVIANGELQKTKESGALKTWSFDMHKPMSSYLLAFAIGTYDRQELKSASGIPLFNYYYPQDSIKVESTYRHTKAIFDFLETEIGVPYPWQVYKQIPVKDFLYAGMENTSTTIFSDAFVIDSVAFIDKNYINVNAHELAHQWFGNLVTEKSGVDHWLHEGFATFYAYRVEKEIFGDEYYYWKLYDSAMQLHDLAKKSQGEALTDPKASSLTFYEKGAWALVMLQEKIGEVAFKQGIRSYLEKYQFKNASIDDLLAEMELAGNEDLSSFKKQWLSSPDFPFEKAKEYLRSNSTAVAALIQLKWDLVTSLDDKNLTIQKFWNKTRSEELKARIITQYHKALMPEMINEAFNSTSIKMRQALALAYAKVPAALQSDFETLLNDQSYVTKENALYRLWISFPNERTRYLEKTKGVIGLPNRNVRMLWLLLAVLTKDYHNDLKKGYLSELYGYTSPRYAMETRQTAFGLIGEVFAYSDQSLLDLIKASEHHSWQFRKNVRNLLDGLLEDAEQRKRIIELVEGLNVDEFRYINTKLNLE